MAPPVLAEVEHVPWSVLGPELIDHWEQGEHVATFGMTGSGKTTLNEEILRLRSRHRNAHVVIFATKRRDTGLRELIDKEGWSVVQSWDEIEYAERSNRRIIVWPPYGRASNAAKQMAPRFRHALDEIIEDGHWTVYFDEMIYFVQQLGLRKEIDEYWNTARSSNITVLASSQGVSWIPKAMKSQMRWVAVFQMQGGRDTLLEVADVCGDRERFLPIIRGLSGHDFLLVRTSTGEAYRSRLDRG
jgi:energy-coupling factor transporter ATP-binding protein EcfA2